MDKGRFIKRMEEISVREAETFLGAIATRDWFKAMSRSKSLSRAERTEVMEHYFICWRLAISSLCACRAIRREVYSVKQGVRP